MSVKNYIIVVLALLCLSFSQNKPSNNYFSYGEFESYLKLPPEGLFLALSKKGYPLKSNSIYDSNGRLYCFYSRYDRNKLINVNYDNKNSLTGISMKTSFDEVKHFESTLKSNGFILNTKDQYNSNIDKYYHEYSKDGFFIQLYLLSKDGKQSWYSIIMNLIKK